MILLGEFSKSACGPSAVDRRICRYHLELRDVLKTQGKPMSFACFPRARRPCSRLRFVDDTFVDR